MTGLRKMSRWRRRRRNWISKRQICWRTVIPARRSRRSSVRCVSPTGNTPRRPGAVTCSAGNASRLSCLPKRSVRSVGANARAPICSGSGTTMRSSTTRTYRKEGRKETKQELLFILSIGSIESFPGWYVQLTITV